MRIATTAAEITPISAPATVEQLKTIAATGLTERGCVNIIQLDAIQREMGEKWPRRREQVWEHVEKAIEANIAVAKTHVRLSEIAYLICLSGQSADAAKMQCAYILRDTLKFFLGTSCHADIVIRNVTKVDDCSVTSLPVELDVDTLKPSGSVAQASTAPKIPSAHTRCSLITCGGPLTLEFKVERVFILQGFVPAARRIKVIITDSVTGCRVTEARLLQLETAALINIDQKTAEFAASLLSDPEHANMGILAPISIQTALNPRGRAIVQEVFSRNGAESKRRLIIELINLTRGTPSFQVAEATAFFQARGTFGRMGMDADAVNALRKSHLDGVVIDTGTEVEFSRALLSRIIGCGDLARSIAPILVVGPLPNEDFVDICRIAGATHVSFASQKGVEKKNLTPSAIVKPYQQLIYTSRATLGAAVHLNRNLESICQSSVALNRLSFVTGLLLYYDGWFLQVLEGSRAVVGTTMSRIFKDTRHTDIQIISAREVDEREFPHWSMTAICLSDGHPAAVSVLGVDRRRGLYGASFEQAITMLRSIARLKDEEESSSMNSSTVSEQASAN